MPEEPGAPERGHTLIEALAALALSGLLVAIAAPSMSGIHERSRIAGAAREIATRLRGLRPRAIAEGRTLGLVFERDGTGWRYTLHADGDEDGLRSADIDSGTDAALGDPERLADRWAGVDFGSLGLARLKKIPPGTGWASPPDDPIQFGAAHIVSFSPRGEGSSGSLYMTDGKGQMAVLVLFGPTGRIRVFRYDAVHEEWLP